MFTNQICALAHLSMDGWVLDLQQCEFTNTISKYTIDIQYMYVTVK